MKLCSFNVNSVRLRLHQLRAHVEVHDPDVIGLQETKVVDADFPVDALAELGYRSVFAGQKTHYGVAILSKREATNVSTGFPTDAEGAQTRLIRCDVTAADGTVVHVVNGYFPQGEKRGHPVKFPAKERFYADLAALLESECSPERPTVVMGDFNVAPVDEDIGIGADNARRWLRTGSTSFLPEEREWFARLTGWGLADTFPGAATPTSTTCTAGSTTGAAASRPTRSGASRSITCSPRSRCWTSSSPPGSTRTCARWTSRPTTARSGRASISAGGT